MGFSGRSQHRSGPKTAQLVRLLAAERFRQKLTQAELIRQMGWAGDRDRLGHAERGASAPTVEFLLTWIEALGLRLVLVDEHGQEVRL